MMFFDMRCEREIYFHLICPDFSPYLCCTHFLLSSSTSLPCLLSGAITKSTDQFFFLFAGVCNKTIKSTSEGLFFFDVKLPMRCISEIGSTFSIFRTIVSTFCHISFRYADFNNCFGGCFFIFPIPHDTLRLYSVSTWINAVLIASFVYSFLVNLPLVIKPTSPSADPIFGFCVKPAL